MTSIAEDFLAEGAALHALLLECSAPDWQRNTSFKSWTIDQWSGIYTVLILPLGSR